MARLLIAIVYVFGDEVHLQPSARLPEDLRFNRQDSVHTDTQYRCLKLEAQMWSRLVPKMAKPCSMTSLVATLMVGQMSFAVC